MDEAMKLLDNYMFAVVMVATLLTSVLNGLTKYFANYKGVMRFITFLLEMFSWITSAGERWTPRWYGKIKPIGTTHYRTPAAPGVVSGELQDKPAEADAPPTDEGYVVFGVFGLMVLCFFAYAMMGCNPASYEKAHNTVSSLRLEITETMDAKCMQIAKVCPKGEGMAVQCVPLMECWKQRRELYQGTKGAQLLVHMALAFQDLGQEDRAKELLLKGTAAVADLYMKLTAYKVVDISGLLGLPTKSVATVDKEAPAATSKAEVAAGAVSTTPVPATAATAVAAPAAEPTSQPASTGGAQ